MIKMLTRLRNSIMRPVDAWCMKRCTRSLSATHGDFIYSPVLPPVIQFASDDFNIPIINVLEELFPIPKSSPLWDEIQEYNAKYSKFIVFKIEVNKNMTIKETKS